LATVERKDDAVQATNSSCRAQTGAPAVGYRRAHELEASGQTAARQGVVSRAPAPLWGRTGVRSRSSRERFMMTLRIACFLSVFVCAAAHAQNCSGGSGGGIDATGNQCSVAGTDIDSAVRTAVLARPAVLIATPAPARATPTGSRATGTMAPGPQTASVGQPVGRFPGNAKPPAEPVRTAKMGNAQEALCSGGPDGGMDAAGNQCNPADGAGSVAVAEVRGR
jgi:hypothetical protein